MAGCLITNNSLSIHEKTTGPIAMKFSGIILGAILCREYVSECQKSKAKFLTYQQDSTVPTGCCSQQSDDCIPVVVVIISVVNDIIRAFLSRHHHQSHHLLCNI
jgi:hypothetical protein